MNTKKPNSTETQKPNITKAITATRSRSLLAVIAVVSFFLSSVLNNLTVVIVMISLLQKIVEDRGTNKNNRTLRKHIDNYPTK